MIAVFDVDVSGLTLAPETLENLSDYLATRLAETGQYQVVPRTDVKARLVEVKTESYKECFDETCQIALGKALAAQKTLSTRIARLGSQCTVNLKVFDLAREASENAATMAGPCSEDGIAASMESAIDKLMAGAPPAPALSPRLAVPHPRSSSPSMPRGGSTRLGGGTVESIGPIDKGEQIVNRMTEETGFLVITTEPTGATVSVNGESVGTSPRQLERMVGKYVVVAELGKFYHPARKEVEVTSSKVKVHLTLPPAYGRLEVTSEPPGAEVWLANEKVGTTPWNAERKPSGSYSLRVSKTYFAPELASLTAADGQTTKKHFVMRSVVGQTEVTSEPSGAEVWVNEEPVGRTPWIAENKAGGEYSLRIVARNHKVYSGVLQVENGKNLRTNVKLEQNWGSLRIETEPSGAAITLNDLPTGKVTPATIEVVEPGLAVVKLTLEGHGDAVERSTVTNRETARVSVKLSPKLGLLSVTAATDAGSPCEGNLWLDGKNVGQTPWKGMVLAVRHDVLVMCGEETVRKTVTIEHNQKLALTLTTQKRTVKAVLTFSATEGFLSHDGITRRTHVGMEVGLALRFSGAPWIQPGVGLGWTVESLVNVTIRPGIQWYIGPVFFRTAAAAMVTPVRAWGFVGGFGGNVPLWRGGFMTFEVDATVWSRVVIPLDFRVGVGHAF
jgi:hypothetical protein